MPVPGIISAGPLRLYELANCVLMLAAKDTFIIFLHLLVVLCSSLGVVDRCALCRILQFENLLLLGICKMVVHYAGPRNYFRWSVTLVWVSKLLSHAGCEWYCFHHISSSPGLLLSFFHAAAAAFLTSCSACAMSKCFIHPRKRRLIDGLIPATNFDWEASHW